MPHSKPAPGEGAQDEAEAAAPADAVDSVKDPEKPGGAEPEVEEERDGSALAALVDAAAGAVGSVKDSVEEPEVAEAGEAVEAGEGQQDGSLVDAAGSASPVASVDGSGEAEGADMEEEKGGEKGDVEMVDVSVAGHAKGDAPGGGEGAQEEVDKLGNGDGDGHMKVDDGEKGSSPEAGGNGDGDNKKEADGENQPPLTPAGEDGDDQGVSKISNNSFMFDYTLGTDDSGTEEEQATFMKELERFHREKMLEFKPPKFYGEGLNCLKLWRQVTGLGGYDQAMGY